MGEQKYDRSNMKKITPFLWFDDQAEEAVNFYVSIFKDSRVVILLAMAKLAQMPPEDQRDRQ